MIDYQQIYHTGIRVPDLAAAMDEMGESLGVTWATPVDNPGRPMKQEVDQPITGKIMDQPRHLGADAGQDIDLSKQRAETFWPHVV